MFKYSMGNKISLQISLKKLFKLLIYIYIYIYIVNFENPTVKFHVLYILNMNIKFCSNWMLFTIRSIN